MDLTRRPPMVTGGRVRCGFENLQAAAAASGSGASLLIPTLPSISSRIALRACRELRRASVRDPSGATFSPGTSTPRVTQAGFVRDKNDTFFPSTATGVARFSSDAIGWVLFLLVRANWVNA